MDKSLASHRFVDATTTAKDWFLRNEQAWNYEGCYLRQCQGGFCGGVCSSEGWRASYLFKSLDAKFHLLRSTGRLIELCESRRPPFCGTEVQILDANRPASRNPFEDRYELFDTDSSRQTNVCAWCIDRVARVVEGREAEVSFVSDGVRNWVHQDPF